MNVVSSSDLWLFLASNGGLTAGRIDAEHALFPYQSVDRIYDSAGQTGPVTAFWVGSPADRKLWEPFARRPSKPEVVRNLYKSVEGDRVWFEEINQALGVVFRYGWSTAEHHGLVRQCELENLGDQPVTIRLLDGLRNLLPAGIPLRVQTASSCLADAYKSAELLPDSTLAVYGLGAAIVDRAIPLESLRASVAWSEGLVAPTILLSDAQLDNFYADLAVTPELQRRGTRCSYWLTTTTEIPPRSTLRWMLGADTGLAHSEVASWRLALVRGEHSKTVRAAVDASTHRLRQLVASADGLQTGAAVNTTVHHFANVLFNIMRGGVFIHGHHLPCRDFAAFVHTRNRLVATRHAVLLAGLPDELSRAELLARLAATGDRDLERLGLEYLPLTFSRRHGDPSRPWNKFSIRLRDARGQRLLAHEGNWRDIFQNWESLCLSYPEFFENIVAKFANASTIDGYNPYRISQSGVDWEVPDHEDPWSSIGYWGDHQTIYLLKLLEWSGRFHPGLLQSWLRRDLFTYAAVPYRIADYSALRKNPHATIEFDGSAHRTILQRVEETGSDARLRCDQSGHVLHVNLTEKLLVLILTRLSNFVPGGGIWMNTQRPEWNDANNALVGYGVSLVTLAYLRRFVVHLQNELMPGLGDAPVTLSGAVANFARQIQAAFARHEAMLASPDIDDHHRRSLLDGLATAGSEYRTQSYGDSASSPTQVAPGEISILLATALRFIDHTLRTNRRSDGLYHSYNVLEFSESPPALQIHRLGVMLEGQVAILSSALLASDEAIALLDALRHSPLYRADQHSYLLYPDKQLPGFLFRNVLPETEVEASRLFRDLLAAGDTRLVCRDADGRARFNPDIGNADALDAALTALARDPQWAQAVAAESSQVKSAYELIFRHRFFTGRSGSMFGYEGLGCIYWHMVAKLLLAVQENLLATPPSSPQRGRLATLYYDIRAGLGFNKTPAQYGAFPTDPYSHTPGHSGAQQPGMTGQVKEEILTRLGELGVTIKAGRIAFSPTILLRDEFSAAPTEFSFIDQTGNESSLPLPAGAIAFTFCGTPITYEIGSGPASVAVHQSHGVTISVAGTELDEKTSARLFARDGSITRIEVNLGSNYTGYQFSSK